MSWTSMLPAAPALTLASATSADESVDEVAESASELWRSVVEALPRLGIAVGVVLVGWGIGRIVRAVVHRVLLRSKSPSFARVMSKVAGWVVVTLAVLAALAVTFPSVKPVDLLAGLGFFSVAVGFAFQDILENTLSGILLLFRQPFRSGDEIEVQDRAGTVEAITIRETRLRTFDGQLVVIPNRDVYKSAIRVQTHYPQRRLSFVVGVAYENDAEEARQVVIDTLTGLDGVAESPAAEALIDELGTSTVNLVARFWSEPGQHDALVNRSNAIVAVKAALDRAGIEMPADIVALQATPSFQAALDGRGEVTPGGGIRT